MAMGISSITGMSTYNGASANPMNDVESQSVELNKDIKTGAVSGIQDKVQIKDYDSAKKADPNSEEESRNGKSATMKDASEFNKLVNRRTIAEFAYNEPTNRISVKIRDKDTGEVIREIPSEKALKMLETSWELAGILVDDKR